MTETLYLHPAMDTHREAKEDPAPLPADAWDHPQLCMALRILCSRIDTLTERVTILEHQMLIQAQGPCPPMTRLPIVGYLSFPPGNDISYAQDFQFRTGLPSDILFEAELVPSDRAGDSPLIRLRAPGYGYPYPDYGAGAIYLRLAATGD